MFKAILWNIDNTLLDFSYAESMSLKACFEHFGLGECSDDMVKKYASINTKHWEKLERGEVTKQQVMDGRFCEFMELCGITSVTPSRINSTFENGLLNYIKLIENSYESVSSLRGSYKQYAVTNGALEVQTKKLADSGLDKFFDGIFISDKIGCEKPSVCFFQYVLDNIIPCEKNEILIIGDSLTSDMTGGNNIGIKCCWYNPHRAANNRNLRIDYEIHSLDEVKNILL